MSDERALRHASPVAIRAGEGAALNPSLRARQVGMLTLEQKRTIERLVGRETLLAVIAGLPDDCRQELEQLSLFAWCRCSTLNLLLEGAAHASGRPVDAFARDVVRQSFGSVLRSVWRLLARFSSDEAIVQRAGMLYSRAIDRGRVSAFVAAPGHLVMEISERPELSPIDVVCLEAAIEAALEVAGRRVRVSHRKFAGGVRYDVRPRTSSVPAMAP